MVKIFLYYYCFISYFYYILNYRLAYIFVSLPVKYLMNIFEVIYLRYKKTEYFNKLRETGVFTNPRKSSSVQMISASGLMLAIPLNIILISLINILDILMKSINLFENISLIVIILFIIINICYIIFNFDKYLEKYIDEFDNIKGIKRFIWFIISVIIPPFSIWFIVATSNNGFIYNLLMH